MSCIMYDYGPCLGREAVMSSDKDWINGNHDIDVIMYQSLSIRPYGISHLVPPIVETRKSEKGKGRRKIPWPSSIGAGALFRISPCLGRSGKVWEIPQFFF